MFSGIYFEKMHLRISPRFRPPPIHDMASFITGVVNAQQITLETDQETANITRFTREASTFLHEAFPGRRIKMNQPLRVQDRGVRFSAGIWRGSRVSLVQYVTGSNSSHFGGSMAKATVNFLSVKGSSLAPSVAQKISLIDTSATGFRDGAHGAYAKLLGETSNLVKWDDRANLVNMVENLDSADSEDSHS